MTIEAIIDGAKCYQCKIPDGFQLSALLYLQNQILSNGGGSGGGTQAFSGSGAPAAQVPTSDAGTYYDYTNKILYNWNPVAVAWE